MADYDPTTLGSRADDALCQLTQRGRILDRW